MKVVSGVPKGTASTPLPVFTDWSSARAESATVKPLSVRAASIALPVGRPIQNLLEHTPKPGKLLSRIRREPPDDPHLLQISVPLILRHAADCLASILGKILEDSIKLFVSWLE